MRVALLALALSLAACGGDPASNTGGMDGGAGVDAGADEALAAALCRLDVPRPTFIRDWAPNADPAECATAESSPCTVERLRECGLGSSSCCFRLEHCGEVRYLRCTR